MNEALSAFCLFFKSTNIRVLFVCLFSIMSFFGQYSQLYCFVFFGFFFVGGGFVVLFFFFSSDMMNNSLTHLPDKPLCQYMPRLNWL